LFRPSAVYAAGVLRARMRAVDSRAPLIDQPPMQ